MATYRAQSPLHQELEDALEELVLQLSAMQACQPACGRQSTDGEGGGGAMLVSARTDGLLSGVGERSRWPSSSDGVRALIAPLHEREGRLHKSTMLGSEQTTGAEGTQTVSL